LVFFTTRPQLPYTSPVSLHCPTHHLFFLHHPPTTALHITCFHHPPTTAPHITCFLHHSPTTALHITFFLPHPLTTALHITCFSSSPIQNCPTAHLFFFTIRPQLPYTSPVLLHQLPRNSPVFLHHPPTTALQST